MTPTTFTDAHGRDWSLEITLGLARRRFPERTGVCLISGDVDDLRRLTQLEACADAIWLLCESQAEEVAVSRDEFEAALSSETLKAASSALWGAITDFFLLWEDRFHVWRQALGLPETPGTPSTPPPESSESTGDPSASENSPSVSGAV